MSKFQNLEGLKLASGCNTQDWQDFSNGRELDDEAKYWRNKIIYSALETVLFNPNPNPDPRLTPEVLGYLRAVFCDEESSEVIPNIPAMSADIQSAIEAQVAMEIEKIGKSLVNTNIKLLEGTDTPESREVLHRLETSASPLKEVLNLMEEGKQAEIQADIAIVQEKGVRDAEIEQLEDDITKVTKALEGVTEIITIQKQPEAMQSKLEKLNAKSAELANAVENVKKERAVLEYSKEVEQLTENLAVTLSTATEEVQKENSELQAFLDEYDKLDPELKDLVSKLKATDEAIKRQEWILEKMRNFDALDEDSLHG